VIDELQEKTRLQVLFTISVGGFTFLKTKKNLNIAVKVFFLPFGMEERLLTAGVKLQPVKSD
jgi:hypothetical protein